ncbi:MULTISPECIES: YciI family protein [unclassified Nocardioides]|uniref:YciI family protein n=1 Tax=unclassified Nocardioides TaxID=2615069 RepID=UPI003014B68F
MTEYVVLLPGDESRWEAATAEERVATYARHEESSRLLAERGHRVTGGSELTHSRTAKVVRRTPEGGHVVTDGPYAEAVEQLSGFYVVESDDLDDLLEICGVLASVEEGVEVRAAVDHGGDPA